MKIKEEEARKKVCPYIKGMCSGSKCMAWRWIDQSKKIGMCREVCK